MKERATRWVRKHAATPSNDQLIRATVVVSVLLVVLSGATLYLTAQGRIGDERANRSDEIRSCSSSFSAELVTGPTAAALKALAEHGTESTEFQSAVDQANPNRFIVLAKMSRSDPDEFLRICRTETG